jgi:hypothetical protein
MTDTKIPWHRVPFVWLLIALPFAAVAGSFATLWLAIRSDDGLVADDYYRRGKEINRDLARDRAADALGLSARVELDPATSVVRLKFTAPSGATLPADAELKFLHATRAGFDRRVVLAPTPAGQYQAGMPGLAPGHWHLELSTPEWRLVGLLSAPADTRADLKPALGASVLTR